MCIDVTSKFQCEEDRLAQFSVLCPVRSTSMRHDAGRVSLGMSGVFKEENSVWESSAKPIMQPRAEI